MPFIVEADHSTIILLKDGQKKGKCVAQIAYSAAQSSGATELVLCDHDMVQMTDEDSNVPKENARSFTCLHVFVEGSQCLLGHQIWAL